MIEDEPRPILLTNERLELVLATPALVAAALAGPAELALLLGAGVAAGWPPDHLDREALRYSLTRLTGGAEQLGWWLAFFVLREPRLLIGVGGYKGPPTEDGTVEIGYSVVREWRRRGLASEAAAALTRHAFDHPRVTRVIAETLPELVGSIGVLERNGFRLIGEGSEAGSIRFERLKEEDVQS